MAKALACGRVRDNGAALAVEILTAQSSSTVTIALSALLRLIRRDKQEPLLEIVPSLLPNG